MYVLFVASQTSNTRTKYQTKPRLFKKKQTKFNLRKFRKYNQKFFEKNLNKQQYKMECEVEWGDLSLWGRSLCKNNDCEMLP
jgi:hypothetical protein